MRRNGKQMTIKEIVKQVCKLEGLKKQVDIAQVSEIIGHISDMALASYTIAAAAESEHEMYACLVLNGMKRLKKNKRGKK